VSLRFSISSSTDCAGSLSSLGIFVSDSMNP
jgi:hypothetical protein